MAEEWRVVDGWPYEVSSEGRLRHVRKRHKVLDLGDFYIRTNLVSGGKKKGALLHTLVAEAFIGPRPSNEYVVNHKNGRKSDNRLENLEWITRRENQRHACAVLGKCSGENHGRSVLTEEQVKQIRARYVGTRGQQTALAREFGVTQGAIGHILRGVTWRGVSGVKEVKVRRHIRTGSVLTEEQVVDARRRYNGKHGHIAALAREYGVSREVMHRVIRGKSWSDVVVEQTQANGDQHGRTRISTAVADEIRAAHAEKDEPVRVLAGRYGTSRTTICRILNGDRGASRERGPILTDAEVAEIRAAYTGAFGEQVAMAKKYGVTKGAINKIVRGKNRLHPRDPQEPIVARNASKLTDEQVAQIRARYAGGRGEQALLAREYKVTRQTINHIVHGLSRRSYVATAEVGAGV